jgi:hypothetical protein
MTAPTWQPIPDERRLLVSPAWFVLIDDWRRTPYSTGVLSAQLDRWDQRAWVPTGIAPVRTPSGVVTYPRLGRRREPWNAEPELYRARFRVPGYAVLYVPDDQLDMFTVDEVGREFLAYPYDDTHPPQVAAEADPVHLLPGADFPYPPGTRVVSGSVRRAGSGTPIANAYVSAQGTTDPEGVPWRERTLTDATGAFRLSLRWAGTRPEPPTELFTLTAVERPEHTGQLTVRLPEDLGRLHIIEISE